MAVALDVVAGTAQFISLAFQLFQGCIEAYKFCHTAQLIGPEGDLLRTKLLIERYRLERWADCAKLDQISPDVRLDWSLVYDILQQQQTLLTSGEKLKKKYGLDLPEITGSKKEERLVVQESSTVPPRGLDRILQTLQPRLRVDSSSGIIAASNGPIKRLRWAAGGRERIVKVIDDLGQLNDQLERLLDLADRTWLRSSMTALLRDTLSRSTDMIEVETLQQLLRPSAGIGDTAVAAAANFKRIRLVLGVDQRLDEVRPQMSAAIYDTMPRLRVFKEKKLSAMSQKSNQSIQTALFEERTILLERRTTDGRRYASVEKHMQSLALLLGNTDRTFASLSCIGLSIAKETCSIGLVYEMPRMTDVGPREQRECRSLYELLSTERKCSLRDRVRIGLNLAEAVWQLHTAGWLHKSIRSDNVIFIHGSNSDAETFLGSRPYLVGYDYARPEAESHLTGLPDAPLYTDLYRHPQKRDHVATGFKKPFDLFALGCVLAELALWERLVEIVSRYCNKDWDKAIQEADMNKQDLSLPSLLDIVETPAFARDVSHTVGPKYLQAITLCLVGDKNEKEEVDVSLTTQRSVVQCLQECQV